MSAPNPPAATRTLPYGEAAIVEAAANLFDALHRADDSDCAAIAVAPIPDEGVGIAINDRLRRAAHR